ncbi:MAG: pyridoxamine 5'-phosphate oxidase family protein [Phycisphaeraceae bacterium]|nr:pyridoxamine 5'-phosphate oxidase family protein [Phycisphaeraceae bacterium]
MPNDRELLVEAMRIVNHAFLGMLTTVGADGLPRARWMGASSVTGGLTEIYTLTGSKTRKVEEIRRNPHVCWVFSASDYNGIVTLFGQAEVLTAPTVAQSVWDRLVECARTYCMSALSNEDNLELVTIRTAVEKIEFISPRMKILTPYTLKPVDVSQPAGAV